ncbi:MAG: hypothetical protein QM760_04230 [Nibricoccus sp.]
MSYLRQIICLVTCVLLAGCTHYVKVPAPTEIVSIEVMRNGTQERTLIKDPESIREAVAVFSSVPPCKPGLLHAQVTYVPWPYQVFFHARDGSSMSYGLAKESIHTQEATWPISDSVFARLVLLLKIKEPYQSPPRNVSTTSAPSLESPDRRG